MHYCWAKCGTLFSSFLLFNIAEIIQEGWRLAGGNKVPD